MPHIAQVMQQWEHKKEFVLWDQNWTQWSPANAGGVCFTVCKMWLRNPQARRAPQLLVQNLADIANIERKQDKYRAKLTTDQARSFKHLKLGGFNGGSHSKHLNGDFWDDAISDIADLSSALISLRMIKGDAQRNHAVAFAELAGECLFFDPNGGVLALRNKDFLELFLQDGFITADQDWYDHLAEVGVYRYDRTA